MEFSMTGVQTAEFALPIVNTVYYKEEALNVSTVHDSCSIFSSCREGSVTGNTVNQRLAVCS